MATARLSVETEFVGLTVRPGDKLVIAFPRLLNMMEANEIKEKIEILLPGVSVVILDGVSGLAVYHPDQVREMVGMPPEGERMLWLPKKASRYRARGTRWSRRYSLHEFWPRAALSTRIRTTSHMSESRWTRLTSPRFTLPMSPTQGSLALHTRRPRRVTRHERA